MHVYGGGQAGLQKQLPCVFDWVKRKASPMAMHAGNVANAIQHMADKQYMI